MAVPTAFPVWMSKSGGPDMQVNDLLSYQNALAIGYSYGAVTPSAVIQSVPDETVQVLDDPLSSGQTDPGQQDQIS